MNHTKQLMTRSNYNFRINIRTMVSELVSIIWFFIILVVFILLLKHVGAMSIISGFVASIIPHVNTDKSGGYIIGQLNTDAKDLTLVKLRIYSRNHQRLQSYASKLSLYTTGFMKSMETQPTDIAISALKKYKPLLTACADIMDKKFPGDSWDIGTSAGELRELARNIDIQPVKSIIHHGDISRAELEYAFVTKTLQCGQSGQSDTECKLNLETARNEASTLRVTNERLREEIRRGLTNHSCEELLRDCQSSKDYLVKDIKRVKDDNITTSSQLRTRIEELQSIISALQSAPSEIDASHRYRMEEMQRDLSKCMKDNDLLVTMMAENELNA